LISVLKFNISLESGSVSFDQVSKFDNFWFLALSEIDWYFENEYSKSLAWLRVLGKSIKIHPYFSIDKS
jgi:hypothetical protein